MKRCPYCGRENKEDAVNCAYCFAAIPHEEPKENVKPSGKDETPSRPRKKK